MARTLIGGVIGALVGIGLHLALCAVAHREATWFVIVIGVLTGWGVRRFRSPQPHEVPYVSAASSALIAIAAMVVSLAMAPIVVAKTLPPQPIPNWEKNSGKNAKAPDAENSREEKVGEENVAAQPPVEESTEAPPPESIRVSGELVGEKPGDFLRYLNIETSIFMAIGSLIAYELGRGGAKTQLSTGSSVA